MTPSQTVGPFFHLGLPAVSPAGSPGEPILLRVCMLDGAGDPVADGMVELWQPETRVFARGATNDDGCCTFEAVSPAAPLNVVIFARGLLAHLCTRIYFAPSTDEVMALVPANRRDTLLARECGPGEWLFDIRLQGDGETVFFDV